MCVFGSFNVADIASGDGVLIKRGDKHLKQRSEIGLKLFVLRSGFSVLTWGSPKPYMVVPGKLLNSWICHRKGYVSNAKLRMSDQSLGIA